MGKVSNVIDFFIFFSFKGRFSLWGWWLLESFLMAPRIRRCVSLFVELRVKVGLDVGEGVAARVLNLALLPEVLMLS